MILDKKHSMAKTDRKQLEEMMTYFNDPYEIERLYLPYKSAINIVKATLENIDNELHLTKHHNPIHYMTSRIKSPTSVVDKLKSRNMQVSQESIATLTDIAGLRVICHYCKDIYSIAGIFENSSTFKVIRSADYIQNPKPNGYRSLHLIVEAPVYLQGSIHSVPVEIQIRTVAMDFWASLEHQLRYKTPGEIPDEVHTKLKNCADVIARTDIDMQAIFEIIN